MKREDIKLLLIIAVGILLIIIVFETIKALLPFVIIALVGLLVYDSIKRKNNGTTEKKKEKDVEEAEIVKEKNIK